jgi:RHS repeat-associated protein
LNGSGGSQVEVNVYFPFGRVQTASPQASFQVSRRFTGQVFDAESGLYYYNARYYDPELGRFIQPDTDIPDLSNPQSYNRYSYCVNDPLRYTDPTGHSIWNNFNPSLLWDSEVYQGIGYAIMGNTSVRSDPNSYQSLMANNGTPLLTGLTDANGNKLGNPATAVVKAGGGALVQAGMMMTPAGEEGLVVKEGASILKNAERGRAAEANVLNEMGLVKNTEKVSTAEGKAIPDALTGQSSIEVKDTQVVNRTKQIRIQTQAAQAEGRQSVLVTGSKTQVSGPAQESFNKIVRRPDLGPQQ